MYDVNSFLKWHLNGLTPRFCAFVSASISLGLFIFIFIDWFVHKRYGITFIEYIYSKLYSISWILGNDYPVSTRSNQVINDCIYYSSLDSKVWRNHLALFRSCEYDLFEKEKKLSSLTNYDRNFTSVDHQSFFCSYNDICYPEYQLMATVWRLRDRKLRILCSYKALELNSNCASALILLAEERANDFQTVEQILRLALQAAENNFNKSKILIDTFDLKDEISVNTENSSNSSLDQLDKLSKKKSTKTSSNSSSTNTVKKSSPTSSSTFKSSTTDFNNLNNLMNKFKFHNIDKEVRELLKELHKNDGEEFDGIKKVLNLKFNFDSPSSTLNAENVEKECSNLINELILTEIDQQLGNLTTENLPYKNYLFTEELIRDYKVVLYTKRRLGMCLRRLGKLSEALKLFKELNKELPCVHAFSCLENLMEIYLEIEAYSDLQSLLAKYDDIKMPKSAALCYTAALMKMRNCAERYQNMKEEPLYSSFLSYNYFNEVNYFQSPDVHVVNTVSKIMNSSTSNQQFVNSQLSNNDSISNNSNSTSIQNGNHLNHHTPKNGFLANGYSNGTLNNSGHHTSNSILNNNSLNNGNSNLTTCNSSIGSPLNLNTSATTQLRSQLRDEMLALEEIYRAVEFNPHVVIYLLEIKPLTVPPEHVLRRGDTEALAYAFSFLKHWRKIPGALQLLQLTWKNAFQLIRNPTTKGHLFYPYPLFITPTDRILMPDHFEISIYPSKDSSLLFMCIISTCLLFVLFLALINRYPDTLTTDYVAFIHGYLFNR